MERLADLKQELIDFMAVYLNIRTPSPETAYFKLIKHTGYTGSYFRVSVGNYIFKVAHKQKEAFITAIKNKNHADLIDLSNKIMYTGNRDYCLLPRYPISQIPEEDLSQYDQATGEDYRKVTQRLWQLNRDIITEITQIYNAIIDARDCYRHDNTVLKTDDLFIRFNAEGFRLFLTLTPVSYTFDPDTAILAQTTPITDDDKNRLFGYCDKNNISFKSKIDKSFEKIQRRINSIMTCKEVTLYPSCQKMAKTSIQSIIFGTIQTMENIVFSQFGGDIKRILLTDGDPNKTTYLSIIDTILMQTWETLDALERNNDNEDIAHFALDTDSLHIFGINKKSVPVMEVIEGKYSFNMAVERFYSTGAMLGFKEYIKTLKNPRIFTHNGNINP